MHNPTIEKCISLFQEASFFFNFSTTMKSTWMEMSLLQEGNQENSVEFYLFRTFLSPDTLFYHICSYKVLEPVYNDSTKCTDMLHVWLPG